MKSSLFPAKQTVSYTLDTGLIEIKPKSGDLATIKKEALT
jgi:hypothetical protein